jgi:hypothetical protein
LGDKLKREGAPTALWRAKRTWKRAKEIRLSVDGPAVGREKDRAIRETDQFVRGFRAARGVENAKALVVVELMGEGGAAIKLRGAFGPKLAREIIEATQGKVAVGYVIHDPDQDDGFARFFARRSPSKRTTSVSPCLFRGLSPFEGRV